MQNLDANKNLQTFRKLLPFQANLDIFKYRTTSIASTNMIQLKKLNYLIIYEYSMINKIVYIIYIYITATNTNINAYSINSLF
jgi:hypothetical protein